MVPASPPATTATGPSEIAAVLFLVAETSADSQDYTYRHAQANQGKRQAGETAPCASFSMAAERSGTEEQYIDSSRHHKPKKHTPPPRPPDQTPPPAVVARLAKEKTEGEPQKFLPARCCDSLELRVFCFESRRPARRSQSPSSGSIQPRPLRRCHRLHSQ